MQGLKRFNLIILIVAALALISGAAVNILLSSAAENETKYYLVEINRLYDTAIYSVGHEADCSACKYVYSVDYLDADASDKEISTFYADSGKPCVIRTVEENGRIVGYLKFAYRAAENESIERIRRTLNVILTVIFLGLIAFLLYIRRRILYPFNRISELPYELSKGHLTRPLPENRSRFFGRFLWGLDLLREDMESSKIRQFELEKEKKTLILSISHDIKTPLSAIKLYARALYEKLYTDEEKQLEAAKAIESHADEIESFVSEIINASKEDFLNIKVEDGCFYLKELVDRLCGFYKKRLGLLKTDYVVCEYSNCLIHGDIERSLEALENIMENAIKYGDGREISLRFAREEGFVLVTVSNTGCTLPERETVHMFDSFWRGSNSKKQRGSGLGLYICRQIFHRMGGDVYAEIRDNRMEVTAVMKMEQPDLK